MTFFWESKETSSKKSQKKKLCFFQQKKEVLKRKKNFLLFLISTKYCGNFKVFQRKNGILLNKVILQKCSSKTDMIKSVNQQQAKTEY